MHGALGFTAPVPTLSEQGRQNVFGAHTALQSSQHTGNSCHGKQRAGRENSEASSYGWDNAGKCCSHLWTAVGWVRVSGVAHNHSTHKLPRAVDICVMCMGVVGFQGATHGGFDGGQQGTTWWWWGVTLESLRHHSLHPSIFFTFPFPLSYCGYSMNYVDVLNWRASPP